MPPTYTDNLTPRRAEELHAIAVADRRVATRPDEHGTGTLWARLPADRPARALMPRSATAPRPTCSRTRPMSGPPTNAEPTPSSTSSPSATPSRRPPLVSSMASSSHHRHREPESREAARARSGRGPVIAVTVALSTLLGDDDQPADLAGFGPIPASLARRIAADPDGTWRRLVTDPLERPVSYGRQRYKPPPDLDAFVRARDQICVFPHCNRPAIGCELDHVQAWGDGGETNPENLTPLCATHHHLKHDHGWGLTRDDKTGVATWTSPTRHKYQNRPAELPRG